MDCVDHGKAGDKDGYGSTQAHEYKGERNKLKLHRLAYCRANNLHIKDIDGKVVMHTCDNPRCINPEHLELGSVADNHRDRVSKGHYCGSQSIRAKLTDADIAFIRANYKPRSKVWNTYTLAKKFGVVHQTISVITRNMSYKEQVSVTQI
ncbi:HNH endonuclease [Acinetobacter phage vB_AbaP_B1]|uniref:HNH endonuclease n=1 Tax=Acinetobacter phage vB_AbaP_B1 TaxID=2016049 RepID=A0A221SBE5_9CAUD|nr:HNH endonuclease [Acinetobacter phage vB_AbaP_B1]ASN73324.1 HNH endonuclease [Acinetobacter phage vB_AbaP_B1]